MPDVDGNQTHTMSPPIVLSNVQKHNREAEILLSRAIPPISLSFFFFFPFYFSF